LRSAGEQNYRICEKFGQWKQQKIKHPCSSWYLPDRFDRFDLLCDSILAIFAITQ
jgi:hypothetical protein